MSDTKTMKEKNAKTSQNGEEKNREISKTNITETSLDASNIPDLHAAEESALDLSSEYWSPEELGEYKVGIPISIEDSIYEDKETGEEIHLPCMIFIEQTPDGELRAIRNGSKRLVATIDNSVKSGQIIMGQSFVKIIFKGKKKNSTNSFMSDRWSVKPLIIEV